MTLASPFAGVAVKRDLQFLREKEIVRVRSLSELMQIRVSCKGADAVIDAKVQSNGAVVLQLDDKKLIESEADEIRKAFLAAFGIPLDRQIDPQPLPLGSADVYGYLLECDRVDQVFDFQVAALEWMKQEGVVSTKDQDVIVCPNSPIKCKAAGRPVRDDDMSECPECQTELEPRKYEFIVHEDREICRRFRELLKKVTGWKAAAQPVTIEKHPFYELRNPSRLEEVFHIYFADRPSKAVLSAIAKSMRPVLVVHTGGGVDVAHLDAAGVAHLSLARELAASSDKVEAKRFAEDLARALRDLKIRQQEKVLALAHESASRMGAPSEGYAGEMYERDVFCVIRSVFEYTVFWTGKNQPDGFCSVVYFPDADLSSPQKFNWSYDAKLAEESTHYSLSIDEERKIWDYVEGLLRQPELQTQGNRLNGHVVVSNSLDVGEMEKVAKFLRREHRLGQNNSNFKLIFMLDEFLLYLYERIRGDELAFVKRRNWLSRRMAEMMNDDGIAGFVLLNRKSAEDLVTWVLRQPTIEPPADGLSLREGLKETMGGKRTKR